MTLSDVVTTGLATWRLSSMLVNEYGPFGMFMRLRALTGIEHDSSGVPIVVPTNNVLSCIWCTSVWVAALLLLLPRVVSCALAISTVAIVVSEKAVGGSNGGS